MRSMTPEQEQNHVGRLLWLEMRLTMQGGGHAWDSAITPKAHKGAKYVAVVCGRCNGKGAIASFSAIYSGKCFACDGRGKLFITEAAYKAKQARIKAQEDYQAKQGEPE